MKDSISKATPKGLSLSMLHESLEKLKELSKDDKKDVIWIEADKELEEK